mgnify:FL=1
MESGVVSIPLELELGRDRIRSWRAENDIIVAGCANDLCLQDFRIRYQQEIKKNPHYRYKATGLPK